MVLKLYILNFSYAFQIPTYSLKREIALPKGMYVTEIVGGKTMFGQLVFPFSNAWFLNKQTNISNALNYVSENEHLAALLVFENPVYFWNIPWEKCPFSFHPRCFIPQ